MKIEFRNTPGAVCRVIEGPGGAIIEFDEGVTTVKEVEAAIDASDTLTTRPQPPPARMGSRGQWPTWMRPRVSRFGNKHRR